MKTLSSSIEILFFLFIGFEVGNAVLGVDISSATCQTITLSDWQCLIRNGYTFAIIETFDGGYQMNNNIAQCVGNAWRAGMKHVDVYAFLCPNCNGNTPASSAVNRIISTLKSEGVQYGMFWFDIEQCAGCWNGLSANAQFVQEAVYAATNAGVIAGVYSNRNEWNQTVGTYSGLSHYPLWYALWDNKASFNDPSAWNFGGWSNPAIKQYNDRGPCSDVDVDYYP